MHAKNHYHDNLLPYLMDDDLHFHLPVVLYVQWIKSYDFVQKIDTKCNFEGEEWEENRIEAAKIIKRMAPSDAESVPSSER